MTSAIPPGSPDKLGGDSKKSSSGSPSVPPRRREDQPRFSIVLATNRNIAYMAETLESVRRQTVTDWELLLVDNGAPDPQALEDLVGGDDRMCMITIDPSHTAGSSRNVGVARTTGEFISYLDDDDVWVEDRLEKHLRVLEEHPEAPASYSGYWHMDENGNRFGTDWRSRQGGASDMLRGEIDTPLGPTVVVRRRDYEAIGGFSPEIPILVDFEFALRLALRGDLVYIDELLLGYRRHKRNMTSTVPANAKLRRDVMEEMIDRQRWAASGRGDEGAARLFDERLDRHRIAASQAAGQEVFRMLRRRQFEHAADQLQWGMSRAPRAFMKSVASAPMSKLRSKIR